MKIVNKGRGVHEREITGIEKLRDDLPSEWMAFTNLEIALPGGGREIDVILIIEDRILAVDLKDWLGPIRSDEGGGRNGNAAPVRSPADKIQQNARELYIKLQQFLQDDAKRKGMLPQSANIPKVQGFVVLTSCKDRSQISPTEQDCVYSIDHFIKMLRNTQARINAIGGAAPIFHSPGLTTTEWMTILGRFFNVRTGPFRASLRLYGSFQAPSDNHCYEHPSHVFAEYDVEDSVAKSASGLLRRWDFTKVEGHFQTESGRREIAGRERAVIAWLNDRDASLEAAVLQPRVDDPEVSVGYWEVFDRRRKLRRLLDESPTAFKRLPADTKIEICRQILVQAKKLHDVGAAHLNLGVHSIWVELPSTVKLSHLMAASFPELQTLGERRYQFLSSARVPEQILGGTSTPQARDVYLLGSTIHHVLYGAPPTGSSDDMPGEWSDSIDSTNRYGTLHPWFSRALDLAPGERFRDASEMLMAFNLANSSDRGTASVIAGLERFRTIGSQKQLFKEYPETRELQETSRISVWESVIGEKHLVIKMWKREGWGDQAKEASRILDFLERAQELIEQPVQGFARLRHAYWLGDAIVLVQDYVDGASFDSLHIDSSPMKLSAEEWLKVLRKLVGNVDGAHQRQVSHGDLKPANIVVTNADEAEPLLIDYLDFAPESDGDRVSTAYAPSEGGKLERDRFALCRIVEEIAQHIGLTDNLKHVLATALAQVRNGPPPNATLSPLLDALSSDDKDEPKAIRKIKIGSSVGNVGPLLADEGSITLRLSVNRRMLFVRGAVEQIRVSLDELARPNAIHRMALEQKKIGAATKFEIQLQPCELEVVLSPSNDFADLQAVLDDPGIHARLWTDESASERDGAPSSQITSEVDVETAEEEEDDEIEEAPLTGKTAPHVNVPLLWRQSIDTESELSLEGIATGDSAYRAQIRRHLVPFQMEVGEFEFDKEDTVMVSRFEGGNRWVKLGTVDVNVSRSDYLQIDTARTAFRQSDTIVQEGTRLKFSSHFEETSRSRRRAAVDKILEGAARIPDLIKIFNGAPDAPATETNIEVDLDTVRKAYGFNDGQVEAFRVATRHRPLVLLQGPPGTGKTRFIGALVHYAIRNGLARNVLVASQSHEAVNGAAESILQWFSDDDPPSILRVGHEGNVSEQLMPFHVGRVEALLKDRFRGEFRERVERVGAGMGLPPDLCADLVYIETVAHSVARKVAELLPKRFEDAARFDGVLETLKTITARFQSDLDASTVDFIEELCFETARRAGFFNEMNVQRFREVVRVAEDFVNSVSTRNRNFEGFLAGTRQVVVGTCVGLGRTSLGLVSTSYDLVVIDEAARCTASELAVPMQAGRWVVLVGDHNQLEPMLRKRMLDALAEKTGLPRAELLRSDFERVFERPSSVAPGRTLTTQYRMLLPIGTVVSDAFYKIPLEHGRKDPLIPPEAIPEFLSHALTWLTTDEFKEGGYQKHPKDRPKSLENSCEAELIVSVISEWDRHEPFRDWLEQQRKFAHVIGIICTYASQADLIRKKLRSSYVSDAMRRTIKIDTVDSYQGKENPVVLLSLVRNNRDGGKEGGQRSIAPGFMYRPNRINVAMSRAMDRLVIVGAASGWSESGPMARVKAAFDRQKVLDTARYVNGAEFRGLVGAEAREKRSKKSARNGRVS